MNISVIFIILCAISCLIVVGSLFTGLSVMAKGGETNQKYGNKMMQARIIFQGLAIVFFMLAVFTSGA